ncbi:MAG TPA: flagellar hook-basal body complex protein FliE [Acidimicrobiales bacterium]|nr:flagellar hook-basal body complex protein FliE [Acidimicrobiales bacterium]
MTVIPPIAAFSPLPVTPTAGGAAAVDSSGGSFSNAITQALDSVQQTQNTASTAEAQAAAGQGSVSDALIDATDASLATQVTVALTNKAVTAFTDVMNLQF